MSNTDKAEVATEVKTRGRVALTPEQKVQKDNAKVLYHGTGEHSAVTSVQVTSSERARIRSFCKSTKIPFFGTPELFAGIIGHVVFGREFVGLNSETFVLPNWSETIKQDALRYDLENESPEITACKKEIEKYQKIAEAYRIKGTNVPAAISGIIEFHKFQLSELMPELPEVSTEDDDAETTVEPSDSPTEAALPGF